MRHTRFSCSTFIWFLRPCIFWQITHIATETNNHSFAKPSIMQSNALIWRSMFVVICSVGYSSKQEQYVSFWLLTSVANTAGLLVMLSGTLHWITVFGLFITMFLLQVWAVYVDMPMYGCSRMAVRLHLKPIDKTVAVTDWNIDVKMLCILVGYPYYVRYVVHHFYLMIMLSAESNCKVLLSCRLNYAYSLSQNALNLWRLRARNGSLNK